MDHAFWGGSDLFSNLFFIALLCCGAFALPHAIGWNGSPVFYVSGYTGIFFVYRYFAGEDIHPCYSKSSFLFAVLALTAVVFNQYKDSIAAWSVGSVFMSVGAIGLVYWLMNLTPP
jgi:hypothetical protein